MCCALCWRFVTAKPRLLRLLVGLVPLVLITIIVWIQGENLMSASYISSLEAEKAEDYSGMKPEALFVINSTLSRESESAITNSLNPVSLDHSSNSLESVSATQAYVTSGSLENAKLFSKTEQAEARQQQLIEDFSRTDLKEDMLKYIECLKQQIPVKDVNEDLVFTEHEEAVRRTCFQILFGNERGDLCKWPSAELVGPLYVDMEPMNLKELSNTVLKFVRPGGTWRPKQCVPRHKVAVIIPFRDRASHLAVLLRQLHGILRRQELMYRVLVIEQDDEYPFNRGKLMNVGFLEALKISKFTCFVFHDVDLIPENDMNDYGCPSSPRHVSAAIDKFGYRLPYESLFGGIEMFTKEHYEKVNGFSNSYWGWGAEDDDLYKRISEQGLFLTRPSLMEGRYKMIKHGESGDKNPSRHNKLLTARREFQTDGISSLQYTVTATTKHPLYTHIKVDLNMEGDMIY